MANGYKGILKILLKSNDTIRVERFAKREKIATAEAQVKLKERQRNWGEKMKETYQRDDFFDPKNYDLVIDTSGQEPKKTEGLVLKALGYKKI